MPILLLLLSLFLTPLKINAQTPPVSVDAYTRVGMVGNQFRITAKLDRHPDNRSLTVEWYLHPGFENRKFYQVDGAQSQRIFQHYITLEEPGTWTVRAVLKRSPDKQLVATTTIMVRGGFQDEQFDQGN